MSPLIAYATEAAPAATAAAAQEGGIFHFLFETYTGLAVLVGACLVLSLLLAFVLERRTRKVFKDRGPAAPGSSFFDDDDEESEEK